MSSYGDAYRQIMEGATSVTSTTTKQLFTLGKRKDGKKSKFGNESDPPAGVPLFPTMVRNPDGSVVPAATSNPSLVLAPVVDTTAVPATFGNVHKKQTFGAASIPASIPASLPAAASAASAAVTKTTEAVKAAAGSVGQRSHFTNTMPVHPVREEFTLDPSWKRELQAKRRQNDQPEMNRKLSYQEAILRNPRPVISGVRTSFQKQGVTALLDKYRPSSTVYTGERPSVAIPSVIPQADLDTRSQSVVVREPTA